MALKEFLPVRDAKYTVEKEEKPKLTIAELTTIESPGRPVPADTIDSGEEEKPKKPRKKKGKAEAREINFKADSILIITEKPQAAQKIAEALGKSRKYSEGKISYFEVERNGKKIIVCSAVGHLFGLNYVSGQTGWPIFNLEWRPSYEKKGAAFTKGYYEVIKKLAKRAEQVIVATDYDVEGEVIGWNVVRFICKREDAKRMKYSTLTKPELEKSYDNLMPEIDWNQAYAGETRHILDWLYGINLSRALMSAIKTTGSFKLLSIGRVQGPALKIIVDREKEIINFKPEPYWNVFAVVDGFEFKHLEDIFDKNLLEKFKDISEGIAETKDKTENVLPPHPFDLTTLQREAYAHHRIGPSQTLAIAQKLYLQGLISYPRTSSQKIPDSINPKDILKKLSNVFPEANNAKRVKPVEGIKSDPAHPSIYPTGEPANVSDNDKKIYSLIVKRFISVFSPDAVVETTRVKIVAKNNPEIDFRATGTKIIEKGWTNVYPSSIEDKSVPRLSGDVKIDEIKIVEKITQPPKRYTPASLITILEKKNLGTKSTRSSIIDTLFNRGYLDGRSIKATPLGMRLIDSLEKYSSIIIDENLTRQLEEEMESMQESNQSQSVIALKYDLKKKEDDVIGKAQKIITDISKEFKTKENEIGKEILKGVEGLREQQNLDNTLNQCTSCKQGNLRIMYSPKTRRSFIGCSNYPNCKQIYSLPPNMIKRSGKDCMGCHFPKLLSIKRGARPWEFCFNPSCPTNIKRREEWERKKAESGK